MKMLTRLTKTVLPIAAVLAMSACSGGGSDGGSGGSGGGGGSTPLATGGFVKKIAKENTGEWNAPFATYSSQHAQDLFLADSIKGSGYIDSLSFRSVDATVDTNCPDIAIRLGHTSLSTLTNTFATNVEEGKGSLVAVFDGNLTIAAVEAGEYFTIEFDKPFYYNGTDNLVIDWLVNESCTNDITLMSDVATDSNTSLWSSSTTSANGNLYNQTQNVQLNFTGGTDTLDYNGTTSRLIPFRAGYEYHIQNMYLASDINGSGPITGLAFQLNSDTVADVTKQYTVKLGHSTLSALTPTFSDNANDFTAVATDLNFTVPAGMSAGDWFWVPLDGSFDYNGVDNLVVDITVPNIGGNVYLRMEPVSLYSSHLYKADRTSETGTTAGVRYHTRFRFNGATTDVVTDGINTTGSIFFPDNANATIQVLYRASELGTAGDITKVACRLTSTTSTEAEYANFVVKMGHTAQESLNSVFADNFEYATVVHNGSYTVPSGLLKGDWIEIPITPFHYDGKRNLVIQFAGDAGGKVNACSASGYNSSKFPYHYISNWDRTSESANILANEKMDIRLWMTR